MELTSIFNDQWAQEMGVVDWAITNECTPVTYHRYQEAIAKDFTAPLKYLNDHRALLRGDLRSVFPKFQCAIVFLFDYRPEKKRWQHFYSHDERVNDLKIASYALAFGGQDYHQVLSQRLQAITLLLKEALPSLDTQISLDVHPILERDLAYRAGLGWFGKNTMLISRQHGSFFLIGSLLCSEILESARQRPRESNHCSACQRCVDHCPTQALSKSHPYQLDARKCLASLTIEPSLQTSVPVGTGEIFGCDICQEVCPWNQKAMTAARAATSELTTEQHQLQAFFLQRPPVAIIDDLESMSNRQYQRQWKTTALARPGREKMLKNLQSREAR